MSGFAAAASADAPPPHPRRTMMAVRAFLCQNVTIGAAFGAFGVMVLPLQEHFGVGRGMVTLALGAAVLAMGLFAPLVAGLIARIGLRPTMIAGLALSAAGYALLAYAPNFGTVLFAYAVPIGLGLTMAGPFPSSVLAGRWFQHNPGPAVGFVNMPVFLVLIPIAAVPLLRDYGLHGLFLALAALHVALLPFAWGVGEGPDGPSVPAGTARGGGVAARALLARPVFWLLALGAGLLHAAGIIASSHLVAFGIERGLPAGQAALLASTMGIASVAGSFGAGLLCARIGGVPSLAVIALLTAAGWGTLLGATDLPLMVAMTLLIGAGGAGVFPAMNVVSAQVFGVAAVPRALALFGLVQLPLNFGLPPLAGVLHDLSGGYDAVLLVTAAVCGAVTLIYLGMARQRPEPAIAPA